jgi:hypothetical protein
MKRQHLVLVFSQLALLLTSAPPPARSSAADCLIQVSEPHPGQGVGRGVVVEGTATLPPNYHLWVFARHESFRPSGWWPQNESRVDPDTGKWKVYATIGGPQDIGDDFDVAVAAFASKPHLELQSYLKDARKTGQYPPIEMPAAACPPSVLIVKKTSHD